MLVMKFGGSSVESAEAIQRVATIVAEGRERRPVVVVSAMGKTTNRLLAMASEAVNGNRAAAESNLTWLREFHLTEARKLSEGSALAALEAAIHEDFQSLQDLLRGLAVLGELTPRSLDAIASFGERLSSVIVAAAFERQGLDSEHVDARNLIVTNSRFTQAAPLFEPTYARLGEFAKSLRPSIVPVMGGFIASNEQGVTTTLGRGGSDFTAAIVGAGIGADEIQIWTDVDGMLTTDPRLLPGVHRIKTISFAEAAELAYFGAKVLHPATVLPAMERNIPVRILNSRRPGVEGTLIVADAVPCRNSAKAIACKRQITVVNVHSTRMLMAHGFLRSIFDIFDRLKTAVDMVTTSEVSVSLTIDDPSNLDAIVRELEVFAEVSVEKDQAIVSLVGENLRFTPRVAAELFTALGDINVRMISQGASKLNLSFVVADSDLRDCVQRLHDRFFAEPDPAVFDRAEVVA
jgi:aspartate kinase